MVWQSTPSKTDSLRGLPLDRSPQTPTTSDRLANRWNTIPKQQQQDAQNETSYSSRYGLHGSDNDAGFSYKYDHFQYSDEEKNDNDDSKRHDDFQYYKYGDYPDDLFAPVGQSSEKSSSSEYRTNLHPYNKYYHPSHENNFGDEESSWVVHKKSNSSSNHSSSTQDKWNDETERTGHRTPSSTRNYQTVHDSLSRRREHRDDWNAQYENTTNNNNTSSRQDDQDIRDRGILIMSGENGSKSHTNSHSNRSDSSSKPKKAQQDEEFRDKEKSPIDTTTHAAKTEGSVGEGRVPETPNKTTIATNDDSLLVVDNNNNTNFSMELLDDEAIEAEAAQEVAYIMALSKSNHYSILLRKDYNPNHNHEESNSSSQVETTSVELEESTNYSYERSRHNRLLLQQEKNRETLDELKSKLSLHSSSVGKDASNPIDVTDNELSNEQQSSESELKSEDALEQALYREIEASLESDNEMAETSSYPETTEHSAALISVIQNDNDAGILRSIDDESQRETNSSNDASIIDLQPPLPQMPIEDNASAETQQQQQDRSHCETTTLVVNPHFDQDEQSSHNPWGQDIPKQASVPIAANDDISILEQNKHVSAQYDRVSIKPRVEPIESSENGKIVLALSKNNDSHNQGIGERATQEENLPSSPPGEEEPAAEVENILIDLIRRKKFNFALQRARYFPLETVTPASKSNRNLALHELICGMVLKEHSMEKQQHDSSSYSNNDEGESELESSLSMLLIETNPAALSTPGDGGYLPLHIACSSSFRDGGFQSRVSLVQDMLTMHSEGARHNSNETGELPLHLAIRWICNRQENPLPRIDSEETEDETIVMFLLMAHPGGATTPDHSGLTPLDILRMNANREREESQQQEGDSIIQRLERYLSFASQLPQESSNENDAIHGQPQKDNWESQKPPRPEAAEQNKVERVKDTRESLEERDGPPIDHIEFAESMSGTEFLGDSPRGKQRIHSLAVGTDGNIPGSSNIIEEEAGEQEKALSKSPIRFYDVVDRRGVFDRSAEWRDMSPTLDSRITKGPSPEMFAEDGNVLQGKDRHRRKTKRRTKIKMSEKDSAFADKLLHELLDASDE